MSEDIVFFEFLPMTEKKVRSSAHYHGHRSRLRERFLQSPASIPDYELIELILYWVYPRQDVKAKAKDLLQEHETLYKFAHQCQEPSSLHMVLRIMAEFSRRILHSHIKNLPLLNNTERVLDYCHAIMDHLPSEQFHIFFLDRKYFLLADEIQQRGTVDQVSLYPREVIKRALALNASYLILVHNHPSGDTRPSKADTDITLFLKNALLPFHIRLLDHFIVGKSGYFSFREAQLID